MLVLVVFLGAMLFTGVADSITMAGVQSALASTDSAEAQNPGSLAQTEVPSTTESQGTSVESPSLPEEFDRSVAEQTVHEQINEIRQNRGLTTLNFDPQLQSIARQHSHAMADAGYIYHTGPDGDLQDRFERAGYECKVSMSSDQYATGGENVAKTWFRERIIGGDYYKTAEELGFGLVNQWMNSSGHRENILREYWENKGIGIVTLEEEGKTAVYATQVFC